MDILAKTEPGFLPQGNARRPLLGLTILLVEDSRYCSEAIRLLCRKSGARLRRADTLAAAQRHLATYRPSLAIVDIGLPDGSGLDLIRALAAQRPHAPVILATSGDDPALMRREGAAAGADGFLPKPVKNLRSFQSQITQFFPSRARIDTAKVVPIRAEVEPDARAVDEDLRHVLALLTKARAGRDADVVLYCAQFLHSLAEAADDGELAELAGQLTSGAAEQNEAPVPARVLRSLTGRVRQGPVI